MAHLEFCLGDRVLFHHPLRNSALLVGRSHLADVSLPETSISRTHFKLTKTDGQWHATDRSRHGIMINEEKTRRQSLQDGDIIRFGPYHANVCMAEASTTGCMTVSPINYASYEQLVGSDESGSVTLRARIRLLNGALRGRTYPLDASRVTIGGPSHTITLDGRSEAPLATLRVVRGRVLVEPNENALRLDGERVREITPIVPGEVLQIGPHQLHIEVYTDHDNESSTKSMGDMVGRSTSMQRVFHKLERFAAHDTSVLITGESGTGKELAARALHARSPRQAGPFIALNCAALPRELFESELFGYEKGAFTGATTQRDGAFQQADGGTLFLDEIGELEPQLQSKLLRTLESGEVRRVGGTQTFFPDVRIVAATNRNLHHGVKERAFRNDLYWRLSALTLELPALRERTEDIELLARTLLERKHPGAALTQGAVQRLRQHHWPGNVRELGNVLTRAFVLHGSPIRTQSVEFDTGPVEPLVSHLPPSEQQAKERDVLRDALQRNGGNKAAAARDLGMARTSFIYRLNRCSRTEQA